jgi:ribosomal protein S12 methylthiotransferase accessory factor
MIRPKSYFAGTHRLVPPADTLERIKPHLRALGITRCADVTDLDRIGIPVHCAIRPRGSTIQITNGKGLRPVDARVSALMEALELFHAERPWREPLRASLAELRCSGGAAVRPDTLPGYLTDRYFSDEFVSSWIEAEELLSGGTVWLPASSVHIMPPILFDFSSNGLASGNDLVEATLHALYELIERDTISSTCTNGIIRLDNPYFKCIDLASLRDETLALLVDKLRNANIKLVLLEVKNQFRVPTFWATLLDTKPFSSSSHISIGYGSHLSPVVAASRAITEAVQSRLTYIHGAREDLSQAAYTSDSAQTRLFAIFDGLKGDTDWQTISDDSSPDLTEDYARVLERIVGAGYRNLFRADLTRPHLGIPVVKVIAPNFRINDRLL